MPLRVLTFAMVFLGVLSIVLTGFLPPPEPLIAVSILLVGFFFWDSKLHSGPSSTGSPRRPLRHRIYSAAWSVLTFLFLAWCCYDIFMQSFPGEDITVRIPIAAMRLSIFLQMYKVYNAKTDRDYVHMFLLSFFQFVSSAGVSVEFYLLLFLLTYVVLAMWAVTLFHFRRQLKAPEAVVAAPAVVRSGRPGSGRLLTPGFFAGTCLASVLVAVLAAILFIIFPRSATSDNPLTLEGLFATLGTRVSGSEGPVTLDMAGIISRNPRPVMRAALPTLQDPPNNFLWRRGALHRYDGKRNRWSRAISRYASISGSPPQPLNTPANVLVQKSPRLFVAASDSDKYNSLEDLRNDPELIPQRFTLFENHLRAPIFSAFTPPVAVEADLAGIACDVDESYRCQHRTRMNLTYTVFTRIPSLTSRRLGSEGSIHIPDPLNPAKRRLYTQLPSDLNPRFATLATQTTQGASTEHQKARAIRDYLAIHCLYSLELTHTPGRNGPLYEFLFENKPGHCEYFASAMVILVRTLGIPSRLAYGYSAGRWDPERKVFEIRQLDAHAWAEAFIKGKGWVAFDPSPPVPDDETRRTFVSFLFNPFTRFFRLCEERWAEGVIAYTRFKQRGAYRFVVDTAKNIYRGVTKGAHFVTYLLSRPLSLMSKNLLLRLLIPVLAASLLLALTAGILRFRRHAKFRLTCGRHQPHRFSRLTVKFYQKMLRLLTRKGMTKKLTDTPLEFARRVASANRSFADVETLTDLYYLVRFGNGKLTPDQSRTIQSILTRLSRPRPAQTSRQ